MEIIHTWFYFAFWGLNLGKVNLNNIIQTMKPWQIALYIMYCYPKTQ